MANSIKDLVGSVDWRKMLSSADTRNALIGSALGATLLGGAGLMQKRDPEESKLAPVGDALMGAVLGGVAGYGIPKGLSLFRDSGALAPDGDVLKSNYLGAGTAGGLAGAGLFGGSLYKTLSRNMDRLRTAAQAGLPGRVDKVEAELDDALARHAPRAEVRRIAERLSMLRDDPYQAEHTLAGYRRRWLKAKLQGNGAKAEHFAKRIKDLKGFRRINNRGFNGWSDLMKRVAKEEPVAAASSGGKAQGFFRSLLSGSPGRPGAFSTHGGHYASKALLGVGPVITPRLRPLVRGGKYAAGGALLGMLAHKLIGPSPANNYKN